MSTPSKNARPAWCRTGSQARLGDATGESPSAGAGEELAVCPLVCRVPALAKSGDWTEDARREGQRAAFVELLNVLWTFPERTQDTLLFAKRWGASSASSGNEEGWRVAPTVFGKFDKIWLARFLDKLGMEEKHLDSMNARDPNFLGNLLCFLLALPTTMPVPPGMKTDVGEATAWLLERIEKVGRLPTAKRSLTAAGYSYTTGSVYSMVWEGPKLKEVVHISGETAQVPPQITVDRQWVFVHWHSDFQAALQLAPISYTFSKFFAPPGGPHLYKMSNASVKEDYQKWVTERRASTAQLVTPKKDCELLAGSRKQRHDEVAEKAKQTLLTHRAKRQRLTEISLQATT